MTRVLITGGTGFLGKHLQEKFLNHPEIDPIFIGSKDYNLIDSDQVAEAFAEYAPHVVLHCAAVCGGILANKNRPADFIRDNTQMALNVYEIARLTEVQKVYSLGSVCAYPLHCPVPFKEDDIWNGKPEITNFPYAQAKRTLLLLSQSYREQYGIGGAHLIPVNLFGPSDHFDLINSHVIPALINKFVNAVKEKKQTVECWGTGEATREFLYAGDAAEAIVKAITSKLDTDLPINLGTGKDISIKDLAYLIGSLTGFTGQIIFNGQVSDGQPKRRLDVSRAKQLLDFEAKTSLRDGLINTIEWYRKDLNRQQGFIKFGEENS